MSDRDDLRRGIDRRDFLKLAGASAAAATVAGCHPGDPYKLEKPDVPGALDFAQGEETFVATACAQCPAACGLRVRVVEGRAVKVGGNPASPTNRGGVGPRGLASTQTLYDPDRVAGPMKRVALKGQPAGGDDDWQQVSWEQALEELGDHLLELREDERGHALCVVTGQERGMTRDLLARFAEAYGTTSFLDGTAKGDRPAAVAARLMQGAEDAPAHDWARADLIVSLGAEPLQASCQKMAFARGGGGRRGRARMVHLGSARTATARGADEYHQVRTGSHGALALGLARVVVEAGLADEAFLADHCRGFEAWTDDDGVEHPGLRARLEAYPPEVVEELTGLPAAVLVRLGHELGTTARRFVLAGEEAYQATGGVAAAMAVHALNAVLGAIDRPGGVLTQRKPPVAEWDEVEADDYAEEALEVPPVWDGLGPVAADLCGAPLDLLPAALTAAGAGRVDTIFLHYTNPVWSRPEGDRWREALAAVPLVVSFSPYWDETSLACADWILPDHTPLERWEDAGPSPSLGHPVFALRQPVVETLLDTRQTADVLLELALYLEEGVYEALPFKDAKDAVKKLVNGLYKAKRGSIVASKGSAFLKEFYAVGGWYDDAYAYEAWDEVLATASGKLELAPPGLFAALVAAGREDAAEACLPGHVEPAWVGDEADFPLRLVPYRPSTYAEGGGANQPLLAELRLHPGDRIWDTQVDVHPASAGELEDGARVVLASPVGEVRARLRHNASVLPGEVRVPRGHGHAAMGRFAEGWGANVAELVALETADPVFGTTPWIGTRVALRRDQA